MSRSTQWIFILLICLIIHNIFICIEETEMKEGKITSTLGLPQLLVTTCTTIVFQCQWYLSKLIYLELTQSSGVAQIDIATQSTS